MPRVKNPEKKEVLRGQVIMLHGEGLSNSAVARKGGCTEGGVRYIIKQSKAGRWQDGQFGDAKRAGRPPKMTQRYNLSVWVPNLNVWVSLQIL